MAPHPPRDTQVLSAKRKAFSLMLPARLTRPSPLLAALALVVLSILARSTSFIPAVIDTDEGFYLLQARSWLGGRWPISDVWDMHPPGAPLLIGLGVAILGDSIGTVRLIGALSVAATAFLLQELVRSAGGSLRLGFAAGVLYIASTPLLTGLATNTEILLAPLVVGALLISFRAAVRSAETGEPVGGRPLVGAGLLVGVALLIKQVAFPEGCLVFAVAMAPALARRPIEVGRLLRSAAIYALACLVPTLLMALAYLLRGEFLIFWDALVEAPLRYRGLSNTTADILWQSATALVALLVPLLLAALGALWPAPHRGRLRGLGVIWLVVATIAVVSPGMFFQHYFLILLPPLAVLGALGLDRLLRIWGPLRPKLTLTSLLAAILVLGWRSDALPRFESGIGLQRPDPVRRVAARLGELVPPGTTVFLANYHAVVYVLADLQPPSRFVFAASLTGHYGSVLPVDADTEVARILATRPQAIVVDRGWMHILRPSATLLLEAALAESYELAASVPEGRGPVEIWMLAGGDRPR